MHLGPSDASMSSVLSCYFQLPKHLLNEAVEIRKEENPISDKTYGRIISNNSRKQQQQQPNLIPQGGVGYMD
ncbi:hypothetical protein MTR_2g058595 [Medicago truncatula]|uniref:Uncharacterized protein n=1 Tax=Medicago truncatula TaxID=3880 RepID=A0A072V875_MEDTR|nr:hypothetical protein MTR_2g058595 [Medicago truncatula]